MNTIAEHTVLLLDSHHGVYTPQIIAEKFSQEPNWDWSEVSKEDIQSLLNGVEDENYWDAWDNVISCVSFEVDDVRYIIVQNEDLWAIPSEIEFTEEDWADWII